MLYLDASALVKRYIADEGSETVLEEMERADGWAMCRIGYVETVRAVGLAGGRRALKRIEDDWRAFDVVEVDEALSRHAVELALGADLRSLDALHLAAALVLPLPEVSLATWDVRLHGAARTQGLTVVPSALGA